MHYIVSRLHLLQLLHGESRLAALGGLSLQLIFVETLKYLVVGKQHHLQVIVNESLVQSTLDSGESDLLLVKDYGQALMLLVAV